jgi:hypothetical protein
MTEAALVPFRQGADTNQIAMLEAEVARQREKVASSLGELHRELHRATSWRHWVGAHPVGWICAGICLGLIVGRGSRRP